MLCNDTPTAAAPHVGIGVFYIFHGSFYMFFAIPCVLAMAHKEILKYSCYKIMFVMGLLDICNLTTSCFISGIYSLNGTTFCGHETSMTIVGRILLGLWAAYSVCCVLLAFNRWLDIRSEKLSNRWFGDSRTWCWLLLPMIYGGYFASPLCPLIVYNTDYDVWVFDLSNPNSNEPRHENYAHTINNIAIVVLLIGFYLLISIEFRRRYLYAILYDSSQRVSTMQKQIIIQSFLICVVTMVATISYILIQFVPFPEWLTKFPQISWQATHGSNGIIYMLFNKTIRTRVFTMFSRIVKIMNKERRISIVGLSTIGPQHPPPYHNAVVLVPVL